MYLSLTKAMFLCLCYLGKAKRELREIEKLKDSRAKCKDAAAVMTLWEYIGSRIIVLGNLPAAQYYVLRAIFQSVFVLVGKDQQL